MNIISSVILGILQGLTEFLPVSSSGHLVLVQQLLPDFFQPGILFDVFLHLGTLVAVLLYFRKIIFGLSIKYYYFIVCATIPAVVVGFFFQSAIENMFTNYKIVGLALIITGILNLLVDRKSASGKLSYKTSFFTGAAQAIAIIPGISRSGSTIFASVIQGVDKKAAAQFSFLLSVPAILGANVLQIAKYGSNGIGDPIPYITGFASSLIVGFIAIKLVFKLLTGNKFKLFAYYCFAVGLIVLII